MRGRQQETARRLRGARGVAVGVVFSVDGQVAQTDTSYPYGMLWNTRAVSRGPHTLRAVARSVAGATAAVQQTVTVAAPPTDREATGSVVTSGLLPAITPAVDNVRLRDTSVTRGLVWSFERDGAPDERAWWDLHGVPYRGAWAPEVAYLGTYYLVYSLATKGSTMLRSTSGRPEGPYVNVRDDGGNLFGNIDGSLFRDTDGTGYLCYESGNIFRINATWTGTTGPVTRANSGGDEGCFLFRANGRYYLSTAKFMDNGRYSAWIGMADTVLG
ncbi:family 43 glycosylhydrolase [Micromonospora sp. 067-2]|uniref:family 43 glycosylhydrolase n=1 Tax=Micromonospora sp. 067-2 TaxID=2789270 RepID=UPI00397B6A75